MTDIKTDIKKEEALFDAEYVQQKIDLIKKGLPVDISEDELRALEETFRGARSFYIDILKALGDGEKTGSEVATEILEESKNLVGVEMALRDIDDFRRKHWAKIKNI